MKKNNIATLLFCMFLVLGACWVSAKVIEASKTTVEPIGWEDTEYETNKQCAYLEGEELEKCKLHFNLGQVPNIK